MAVSMYPYSTNEHVYRKLQKYLAKKFSKSKTTEAQKPKLKS